MKTRILTKTLPHEKLRVIESKGCLLEMHDKYLRYREESIIEELDEDDFGVWKEYLWNNDIRITKQSISSVSYCFDNDRGFFCVEINSERDTVRMDCIDWNEAKSILEKLSSWLFESSDT